MELKSFNIQSCQTRDPPSWWKGSREEIVSATPWMLLSTYGLRGSFGFCRLHVQVGHHGLQALFVFRKLVGRKCSVISLNTDTLLFKYPI